MYQSPTTHLSDWSLAGSVYEWKENIPWYGQKIISPLHHNFYILSWLAHVANKLYKGDVDLIVVLIEYGGSIIIISIINLHKW